MEPQPGIPTEFSETLGLGLEIQDLGCQDQVLVSVLTEFSNQDQSWYWSCLKFYFKTCLGLGLVWKLVSREVLVLVLKGKKIKTKSIPKRIIKRNRRKWTTLLSFRSSSLFSNAIFRTVSWLSTPLEKVEYYKSYPLSPTPSTMFGVIFLFWIIYIFCHPYF